MTEEFKVTWGVDDGFVGNGTRNFTISTDEIDEGQDEAELREMFWDMVQNEFEQHVHYYSPDEEAFVSWAKERIAEMKAAEES